MSQTNGMGKATGNKPKGMKCKQDTGTCVNIMPLSTYKYIKPSEFDEQGKPIDGHGQYRSILKITMATLFNSIGQGSFLANGITNTGYLFSCVVEAEEPILFC